jgi:hypothetical protein
MAALAGLIAEQVEKVNDMLVEALRAVSELDQLHELLSNDYIDERSCPAFSGWLVKLVNAERRRRKSGGEPWYPLGSFTDWPAPQLVQAGVLTLAIAEAAAAGGQPAIRVFAFRLHHLLLVSMAARLLVHGGR